jgi:aryl-alcohol dehydrogenase-like predicted oxidoreductase
MNYRPLGNTGLRVSEIGFGSWQLGNRKDWNSPTETAPEALVLQALDAGCNFFDTAPNYGGGESEAALGRALRGRRHEAVIATKFGHHADGTTDFSLARMRASLEHSLRKLGTDHLDVVLLHNPPGDILANQSGHFDELEKLKAAGMIRAYGASIDSSADILTALENTHSQVLEVLINVFRQEPLVALPRIRERQAGLIIKVPLDSGWLSGKYSHESTFSGVRDRWSPETIRRRAALVAKLGFATADGSTLPQAALRFLLRIPEVSTVIPGMKDAPQLRENLSASDQTMPDAVFQRLRDFWRHKLADHELPW